MAPRPAPDRLDRGVDRLLRAFARFGAVVVVALTAAARTRRGRRAAAGVEARLAAGDRLLVRHSPALGHWAARADALLHRIFARWPW